MKTCLHSISRRPQARGERGVTLITFALSLVALFAVIALVLGGSLGYDAERNSQTASDTAALAATSVLRNVHLGTATKGAIFTAAQEVAEANGSNALAAANCVLIRSTLAPIATCSSASDAQVAAASGVRVDTGDTRDVPFGEVSGARSITGATVGAATIQPVIQGQGPFMVCAAAYDADPLRDPLVDDGNGGLMINPAAKGEIYVLQGNPVNEAGRDCGHPAESFRGWVKFESAYPIPGDWEMEEGNKTGHIDKQLVSDRSCGGQATKVEDFIGCHITVPLCTSGSGSPSDYKLRCVAIGTFEIVWNNNGPSVIDGVTCSPSNDKHICGRLIDGAVATGGQGSSGQATTMDTVVIKLVQ